MAGPKGGEESRPIDSSAADEPTFDAHRGKESQAKGGSDALCAAVTEDERHATFKGSAEQWRQNGVIGKAIFLFFINQNGQITRPKLATPSPAKCCPQQAIIINSTTATISTFLLHFISLARRTETSAAVFEPGNESISI
ncbi:hypothetical protein niasHT_037989 [Heterodera trifolii]|uniref:Uncharacterized protein n=1 Tax=Heterodera trifolii TaxID=157864 RepID=A0ABD2HMY5_9BILA